jgi:hypothetical protein
VHGGEVQPAYAPIKAAAAAAATFTKHQPSSSHLVQASPFCVKASLVPLPSSPISPPKRNEVEETEAGNTRGNNKMEPSANPRQQFNGRQIQHAPNNGGMPGARGPPLVPNVMPGFLHLAAASSFRRQALGHAQTLPNTPIICSSQVVRHVKQADPADSKPFVYAWLDPDGSSTTSSNDNQQGLENSETQRLVFDNLGFGKLTEWPRFNCFTHTNNSH